MAKKLAKKSTGGKIERLEGRAERVMGRAQKNWKKGTDALKYDETASPGTSNAVGYANKKLNQAARQEDRAKNIMAKANKLKAINPATGGMQRKGGSVKMNVGGPLKDIPAGNKGLPNLPTPVRNNMGYKKKGGIIKKKK